MKKKFNGEKVVTFIRKFEKFYPAENYHQDYYKESLANYLMYKKACGREEQFKENMAIIKKFLGILIAGFFVVQCIDC